MRRCGHQVGVPKAASEGEAQESKTGHVLSSSSEGSDDLHEVAGGSRNDHDDGGAGDTACQPSERSVGLREADCDSEDNGDGEGVFGDSEDDLPLPRKASAIKRDHEVHEFHPDVQVFRGEWDDEGVFFYQAFNDDIADWALQHQCFGGPKFKPARMTWIKPSFAWVLYRSGYGRKHNQNRILKVKVPHTSVADLLSRCQCKEGGGGSNGRVQWDPGRDLESWDGRAPRELLRDRAIQIGLKGANSELYVQSVVSIQDVTNLGHRLKEAHAAKSKDAMALIRADLPRERPYLPCCEEAVLKRLQMLPGVRAPKPVRKGKHR